MFGNARELRIASAHRASTTKRVLSTPAAHTPAFTCMEWLLAGQGLALHLPALPPGVRGQETLVQPERVALVPEAWWPKW